jgi:hypothetical protein
MAHQSTDTKRLLSYVIADWACALKYEHLSPEAIQAAKLFWFDSIGCALGGSQQQNAIATHPKKLLPFAVMSITAKVHQGSVTLPPDLNIPDGTEVEIVVPSTAMRDGTHPGAVRLPVFNGGGLQPGVNLDDSRAIRQLLDESTKLSQLP